MSIHEEVRSPWDIAVDLIDRPDDTWEPLPHQIPPPGNWFGWLLLGGRGAGKTESASRHFYEHVTGPPCLPGVQGGHWPGIIAPTLGDGVTSCVNGPSGLKKWDPRIKVVVTPGGTVCKFPNGVEAKMFGAHSEEDVERLRSGGNRCIVWGEEIAAWRFLDEAWQHMRYGLRVGPRPHWVASTTPKNRKLIKTLLNEALNPESPENPEIVITRAITTENPHLQDHVKKMLLRDYQHTRLGQQELYAMILDDIEGALWTPSDIDRGRIATNICPTTFDRLVVAVDPPASEYGAEAGITASGLKVRWDWPDVKMKDVSHGFLLADDSLQGDPNKWAKRAVQTYHDWGANLIVAEINNGGDMVKTTINTIDPSIYVHVVHATRGKAKRAEPVVSLYQQDRIHHVGVFPKLEDQMTTWDAIDPKDDDSPDRMDSLVWGFTFLMVGSGGAVQRKTKDNRLKGRR